ncbi:MAG: amidase [Planctomycetaceae bacterium]
MATPFDGNRRQMMSAIAAAGISSAAFQRALAVQVAEGSQITADSIRNAEWVADIELTDDERTRVADAMERVLKQRRDLQSANITSDTLPAFRFDPEIGDGTAAARSLMKPDWLTAAVDDEPNPAEPDGLPFRSIRSLARMLRSGQTTSVEMTELCLARLAEHDPTLKCVVTLTPELALEQARRADDELRRGVDRGLLHGIPWGAKDLISVPGYPTTWGAPQFRDRELPGTAAVARRLDDAGAVLVAKLSLGALAMGDDWYGGKTRNPWNPEQGSSGSSAGSAAAVAAGLVPLAIGSETLGSIVSPCKRCGVAGLRPTFGRVSRAGCMSLSWTMDKLGPIARSVDDCGIALAAIHGADVDDPTSVQRWFDWPMSVDLTSLRIGRADGENPSPADAKILDVLTNAGARIVPVTLPRDVSEYSIAIMGDVEAAAVFHDLLAAGDTDGLNRWPDIFRKMHFVSGVDYLRAARARTLLMMQMTQVFEQVDLYVGGSDLGICNLTGHPTLVFPTVTQNSEHPQPECGTLTGRLYDEATLLAVGSIVEREVGMTSQHPCE